MIKHEKVNLKKKSKYFAYPQDINDMFKLSMTLEDVMFDSLRFEIWKRINGTNDSFSVKVE